VAVTDKPISHRQSFLGRPRLVSSSTIAEAAPLIGSRPFLSDRAVEWLPRQNPLPLFIAGRCGQTNVASPDADFGPGALDVAPRTVIQTPYFRAFNILRLIYHSRDTPGEFVTSR
jgi:hypothetical protein